MNAPVTVSVIIPTYNRMRSLQRTLDSLAQQAFPMERLEVIVVDDGSTDGTSALFNQPFPCALRCVRQANQGATAARNLGARQSSADLLVFMDDDVTILHQTLEALAEVCSRHSQVLVMGTIHKRTAVQASIYAPLVLTMAAGTLTANDSGEFHFVDCNTQLLACRRSEILALGLFQDPTEGNGWPNWDDVDLGYRAHRQGFRILAAQQATAEHWDDSLVDRTRACQRYFRAGRSAVWLLKKYPDLQACIPMLLDKQPPAWRRDPPALIVRKLARQVTASPLGLAGMTGLVNALERHYPAPAALRRLYYLLHGAHLLRGYRAGLREFHHAGAAGRWPRVFS